MEEAGKTRTELEQELTELRERVAGLEASEAGGNDEIDPQGGDEPDLKDLFENANDLIQCVNPDGGFIYVNKKWREVLGYSEDDVSTLNLMEVIRPDQHAHCMELFGRVCGGESFNDIETVFVARDGREVVVEGNVNGRFRDGRFLSTRGIFRDITDRKEMENALRNSERRYRHVLNAVSDILFSIDLEGNYTFVNKAATRITGYSISETLKMNMSEVVARPEDLEMLKGEIRRAAKGEEVRGFYEYPIRTKSGEIRFIEINMAAERDREGRINGFSGVARDITQRKHVEQELVRLERLRALGEMSAGVSHNLNNILTGILGPAEFLRASSDDPDILTHVETIRASAERAAALVSRLHRAVRREEQGAPEPVDVNSVVLDAVEATRPRWEDEAQAAGITVEVLPDLGDVPRILGTRSGLHDILANLFFNAVDAMPEGGSITIDTRATGDSVTLTVCDTGVGMDREVRRRVFEPFFTTKAEVGTGLGLSTTYNTVSRWGGSLDVESTPGKGSSFTIQLPAWRERPERQGTEAEDGPVARGRIVIVEDQEVVCELLSSFLSHGHTVETFLDGPSALERFEPGAYDVALIDLGMPGMAGDQVARKMKEADPALVAVLVTGWEIEESDPRSSPFDLRLQKPFTRLADLEAVVAQALDIREKRIGEDE